MHIHPNWPRPDRSEFDLPFEDVSFPSKDGVTLAGWYVSAATSNGSSPAVVLLHGIGDRMEQMLPHAAYLHRAGYSVMMFDFRGCGRSGGGAITLGANEWHDVVGALDYLASRPDVDMGRVGLQGASLGGAVGIMTAARDGRPCGLIAEAPIRDIASQIGHSMRRFVGVPPFPFAPVAVRFCERRMRVRISDISAIDGARGLRDRPLMIVENGRDGTIVPGSVRAVYEAASGPKQHWLIEGARHVEGYAVAGDEYERRVLAFWADVFAGGPGRARAEVATRPS